MMGFAAVGVRAGARDGVVVLSQTVPSLLAAIAQSCLTRYLRLERAVVKESTRESKRKSEILERRRSNLVSEISLHRLTSARS